MRIDYNITACTHTVLLNAEHDNIRFDYFLRTIRAYFFTVPQYYGGFEQRGIICMKADIKKNFQPQHLKTYYVYFVLMFKISDRRSDFNLPFLFPD